MANEFIGIDVSKSNLDLAYIKKDQSIEYFRYENNLSGLKKTIKLLKKILFQLRVNLF